MNLRISDTWLAAALAVVAIAGVLGAGRMVAAGNGAGTGNLPPWFQAASWRVQAAQASDTGPALPPWYRVHVASLHDRAVEDLPAPARAAADSASDAPAAQPPVSNAAEVAEPPAIAPAPPTQAASAAQPTATQEPSVGAAAAPNAPAPEDGPYVAAVCRAFDAYLGSAAALIVSDPKLAVEQSRFIAEIVPALDALAAGLAAATPPADVRAYHNQVLAAARDAAEGARTGRFTSFDDLNRIGSGVTMPSPETQARMETLAARTAECQSRGGRFFIG
jgi:hypothetical protein